MRIPSVSGALPGKKQRQQGVVLLISLILLVAMTLTGIALFRQVGSGVLIARNLSFANAALVATDIGAEAARNWLVTSGANLNQASIANAYFPAWCNIAIDASNNPDANNDGTVDDCKPTGAAPPSEFNPTTYNWTNSVLATTTDNDGDGIGDDGNGNTVRYVIHRLCRIPGSVNSTNSDGVAQECVTIGSSSAGGARGASSYGVLALQNTMQPYYRVTSRTTGPSNTVSFSQVILY